MYDGLTELNEVIAEADRQIKAKGKQAIGAAFKELFAAHPLLRAVRWTQYTPSFNDGDPCEFGVNEAYVSAAWTTADDSGVDDPDEDVLFEYPSTHSLKGEEAAIRTPVYNAVSELMRTIPERAMLVAFGDGYRVTASREGFDVEEYGHE